MIPANLIFVIMIASFALYYLRYYINGAPIFWQTPSWWGMVASVVPTFFYIIFHVAVQSVTVSRIMLGIAIACAVGALVVNRHWFIREFDPYR